MKTISDELKKHTFFEGFSAQEIDFIASCGRHEVFKVNDIIAKEQADADSFYLIKKGLVGICKPIPNQKNPFIQTLDDNQIFGWSWLFPPYKWTAQAIALKETRTISLDGKCLRRKLEENPELGYKLMKRFSLLISRRLNATRLQMMDVYGAPNP